MSVTIHGIECRNCYDVDWARRVEAEDKKNAEAEAAQKAKEAIAPPGSPPAIISGPGETSGFDSQPAIVLDGALKDAPRVDASGAVASIASARPIGSTPLSVNIIA